MNYIYFLKHLIASTLGRIIFFAYIAKYSPYFAAQKIHRILQDDKNGIQKKALMIYLFSDYQVKKEQIQRDYKFYLANKDKTRLSDQVVAQYSDDSLKGYGDYHYDKGGETLPEQQRGLVLPLITDFLNQNAKLKVAEIGTANGDVIAHLAEMFPQHQFNGIDFSVKTAEYKHNKINNLTFTKGYPLALIEEGAVDFDAVFLSSTLLVFTPKEIEAYLKELKQAGCKHILINEPFWADCKIGTGYPAHSEHLEEAVWFHNYPAYFEKAGYKIEHLQILDNYKHPKSQRADIQIVLCHASCDK